MQTNLIATEELRWEGASCGTAWHNPTLDGCIDQMTVILSCDVAKIAML